jgi:hypothetical protein
MFWDCDVDLYDYRYSTKLCDWPVSVLFLHTLGSQQSSVPLFKPLVEAGKQAK